MFSFAERVKVIESINTLVNSIKIEPRDKWAGFAFLGNNTNGSNEKTYIWGD